MEQVIEEILESIQNIEILIIIGLVIILPHIIYVAFDQFCKRIGEKVYAKMEERKEQKEYDEKMTRHMG